MPGRMSNQSIKTSLAVPWWEENKVRKSVDGQGNLFQQATAAELQKKIDDGRRAKMEADEMERLTSDKWLLATVHEQTLATAGLHARNTAREAQEIETPKLFAVGLAELLPDEATREKVLQKLRDDTRTAFTHFQTTLAARIRELIEASKPALDK